MTRNASSAGRPASRCGSAVGAPMVFAFDGPLGTCLADAEDALRRAIVQVGDVDTIVVQVELSLPALKDRVDAGDAIRPAWTDFIARIGRRYGLPEAPRVRYRRAPAPLVTLVVAYRS